MGENVNGLFKMQNVCKFVHFTLKYVNYILLNFMQNVDKFYKLKIFRLFFCGIIFIKYI